MGAKAMVIMFLVLSGPRLAVSSRDWAKSNQIEQVRRGTGDKANLLEVAAADGGADDTALPTYTFGSCGGTPDYGSYAEVTVVFTLTITSNS